MADPVESFLMTGEHDRQFPDWPGNLAARRAAGTATMRDVLVRVTQWRVNRAPLSLGRVPPDAEARVRTRIAPLIEGMFDPDDAAKLLSTLPERVVVLTPSTFAAQVSDLPLGMGWDLANVLLDAVGAPPLGDDAPELDGLCDAGRAFVLPAALRSEQPFPDVVVHEVAHLLHIVPAVDVGLGRAKTPVLEIPPRERETFAYACEVWAGAIHGGLDGTAERALQFASTTSDARANRKTIDALLSTAAKRPEDGWAILRAWVESLGRKRARSKTR
jgi:hypothetical protein